MQLPRVNMLMDIGESGPPTSSPSSPRTSPTTSPNSLPSQPSTPSVGAWTTSTPALPLLYPEVAAPRAPSPFFFGELWELSGAGVSFGTTINRLTSGKGDVGGKQTSEGLSEAPLQPTANFRHCRSFARPRDVPFIVIINVVTFRWLVFRRRYTENNERESRYPQ